jgi:hypothetical protein
MAEARKSQSPRAQQADLHPRYCVFRKEPRVEAIWVNACHLPYRDSPSAEIEEFKRRTQGAKRLIINSPRKMIHPRPFGRTDYALIAYASFPAEKAISFMDESRNEHFKQLTALGFTPEAIVILSVLGRFLESRLEQVPTERLVDPAAKAIVAMQDSHECLSGVNTAFAIPRFFNLVSQLEFMSLRTGEDAILHTAYEFELFSKRAESFCTHPAFISSLLESKKNDSTVLVFPTYLTSEVYESLLTNIKNGLDGERLEMPYWKQYVAELANAASRDTLESVSAFFGMGT